MVKKTKTAPKKHRYIEPWRCSECSSWVFVLPDFHAMLCKEAQKHPELAIGAQKWYDELKRMESQAEFEPIVKKTRKSKDTVV